MPGDLLVLDSLVKRFGSINAVDGLSLSVKEGEVLSVIGPNGAGKTTTFNLITGKFQPTSGHVTLEGETITGMEPYEIVRQGLARSFQITQLFSGLSVLENVRLATQAHERGSRLSFFTSHYSDVQGPLDKAHSVLEEIGMAASAEQNVDELSHGEQRRLEIGIALACDPKVLCLDEPTAGMSSAETNEMIELIQRIAGDVTITIVEHDMEMVMEISDRIAVMNQGQLVTVDDPDAVRANKSVQEAYLGTVA